MRPLGPREYSIDDGKGDSDTGISNSREEGGNYNNGQQLCALGAEVRESGRLHVLWLRGGVRPHVDEARAVLTIENDGNWVMILGGNPIDLNTQWSAA